MAKRLIPKVAAIALIGSVLALHPGAAQELPPAARAASVKIIRGPRLEIAHDHWAIIRWATNNPRGLDEHFGVVHYGTGPDDLSKTARSHIRLNRNHPDTIFRVFVGRLRPETTYYYAVTSIDSAGESDGEMSAVHHFTTPGPGQRIVAYPAKPAHAEVQQ